jgi:hypothetical protein
MFRLAEAIAEGGAREYQHVLAPRLVIDEVAPDGRLVISELSVWGCMEERQSEALWVVRRTVPAAVFEDFNSNLFGIRDLANWHLNWAFCVDLFEKTIRRTGSENSTLAQVNDPERYALGWANAAARRSLGDESVSGLVGHLIAGGLSGMALAQRWPVPPYLDRLVQP